MKLKFNRLLSRRDSWKHSTSQNILEQGSMVHDQVVIFTWTDFAHPYGNFNGPLFSPLPMQIYLKITHTHN